jgi:hypothetical protein
MSHAGRLKRPTAHIDESLDIALFRCGGTRNNDARQRTSCRIGGPRFFNTKQNTACAGLASGLGILPAPTGQSACKAAATRILKRRFHHAVIQRLDRLSRVSVEANSQEVKI